MSSSRNSTNTLMPPQPMNICKVRVDVWYICRTNAAASLRISLGYFLCAKLDMIGMPPKKDKLSWASASSRIIYNFGFRKWHVCMEWGFRVIPCWQSSVALKLHLLEGQCRESQEWVTCHAIWERSPFYLVIQEELVAANFLVEAENV